MHHRKVFRDLPVRLEFCAKSAPSVVDLPFGFSGFNNQARSFRPFCGSPVEQPFDCRSTKPKGTPLRRHKEPGSRTIVCASYSHYRWRVRPDATQFFCVRTAPASQSCSCSSSFSIVESSSVKTGYRCQKTVYEGSHPLYLLSSTRTTTSTIGSKTGRKTVAWLSKEGKDARELCRLVVHEQSLHPGSSRSAKIRLTLVADMQNLSRLDVEPLSR